MSEPTLLDRFRGCLLGLAVGDAVGSPFEGVDGYGIYSAFGSTTAIVQNPPVERLEYTDDTEMAIGIAETLIQVGSADLHTLATSFARNYDPRRGYGMGAKKLLQAIKDGGDWNRMAETVFPGGSLGNGGGMRVAPIGLFFHHDLDRVDREAAASALVTHRHPVGVDGARVLALAVAMAMQPERFDRTAFFSELFARAQTEQFQEKLETAAMQGADISPSALGNSVLAHESVVTAVLCFDQFRTTYEGTLASALRVGGDVDTIAAMACAISGAALGISAVPMNLRQRLENGTRGHDYIESLAVQLYERYKEST